jgi:hypothetical protein
MSTTDSHSDLEGSDWQPAKKNYNKQLLKKQTIQKYLFNNKYLKDKIHFIPKNIKEIIDTMMKNGVYSTELFTEINKKIEYEAPIRPSTIVYILNKAAALDNLNVIEHILDNVECRSSVVNAKCGTMSYTPIFKSAYKGSIRAIKMLIVAGADLKSKNIEEGETVIEALEQGLKDEIAKNPSFEIFTRERYEECRSFIENYKHSEEKKLVFKKITFNKKISDDNTSKLKTNETKEDLTRLLKKAIMPKTDEIKETVSNIIKTIETRDDVDNTVSNEVLSDDNNSSELLNTQLKDFFNKFKNDEVNLEKYISIHISKIDLILGVILQNNLELEFSNFINVMNKFITENKFINNIKKCIQNDNIKEQIKYYAPYAVDKLNNLINLLK